MKRTVALIISLMLFGAGSRAQTVTFGAGDDPRESLRRFWWKQENSLDVSGGLSLIGAHWRFTGDATAGLMTGDVTARLSASARAGIYGTYRGDFDEPYDALRVIDFVRYDAPQGRPLYGRLGPITRAQLGSGHLVYFYNSNVAWDERTIGVETSVSTPVAKMDAFTDNVLLNGVTGGRLGISPLGYFQDDRIRSATLGLSYVTDLGTLTRNAEPFVGYSVDASIDALSSGAFQFTPFVSYAWYRHHGDGLSLGASLHSTNFIDLARFHLKMALFYNDREFIPGYIGSFYEVSNPRARILKSEDFRGEPDTGETVGMALVDAAGGNDLLTELRLLFFNRFELWYAFRRHYGTQSLSEYHLRLFARAPDRLELSVGMDRGGLRGFLTLFNDIGDQTALTFDTRLRVARTLWIYTRSRYTYERAENAPDGTARYLVDRRFEPTAGLRFIF